MEEIKVGEYVRAVDGNIQKINKIIEGETNMYFVKDGFYYKTNIVKHSFNIIDLIEVGDIVELFDVLHYDIFCVWSEEAIKAIAEDVKEGMQIKSIVTKEQFESIKYKVGD